MWRVPTFLRYTVLFTTGMGSMMLGATLVHNYFQPSVIIPVLTLPPEEPRKQQE